MAQNPEQLTSQLRALRDQASKQRAAGDVNGARATERAMVQISSPEVAGQYNSQPSSSKNKSYIPNAAQTATANAFKNNSQAKETSSIPGNNRLNSIAADLNKDNKRPSSQAIKNNPASTHAAGSVNSQGASNRRRSGTLGTDWRVKLDLGAKNQSFYNSPLLSPLKATGGVVFPFTPQLAVTHNATYIPTAITHANFQHYTYANSDIGVISISGEFIAQNQAEGNYLLAVIHFFRSVTKMYFGSDGAPAPAGTPPPILFLRAHGPMLFDRVPVVVTTFTSTFPSDTDYLYVNSVQGETRVPTMMNLAVTVQPVFNRKQADTFSLSKFVNGGLLKSGYI
jgi:uncharacterized protein YdbL (DUF1318 family)